MGMKKFLDELASKAPVPGGGSVAALVGTLASCLGLMVCNISDIPTDRLDNLRKELEALIKKDEEAFKDVMVAYKTKDPEKKNNALKKASLVPLETAEKCLHVLEALENVGKKGKKSAISDIGVGALLAQAGIHGAILNIKINTAYMKEEGFIQNIEKRYKEIQQKGDNLTKKIMENVEDRL
jgi:formiminotetrahydrofolate cyclodeaminase